MNARPTPAKGTDTGMTDEEVREAGEADELYMQAARRDPAIRHANKITLTALGFHLWCMTREERASVTVESLRESKNLLHGYITDEEIAAVLSAENNRVWIDSNLRKAA